MADLALKKLEDQLDCSICLDTYANPKLLQCFHIFCQKCLVKLVFRNQQGQLVLSCPTCRKETPIPPNGVAGLQTAFHINQFLDIVHEHKKAIIEPVNTGVKKIDESLDQSSLEGSPASCTDHGREVALYCDSCREMICWKCIKKGGKHHSHDYEELDDEAFERCKNEIAASLEPMESLLIDVSRKLDHFGDIRAEIELQQ